MRQWVIVAALFVLVCQSAVAALPKKLFDVALEDVQGAGRVLSVGVYEKLPRPAVVDKIIRESLNHAFLIDPTVDILATGYLGNDTLNGDQHSGILVYRASQKKVMTFDEYLSLKATKPRMK